MKKFRVNRNFFIFSLLIFSLILVSCEDFFHITGNIINESNAYVDTEPVRIYIGGNFNYTMGASDREALVVTDGYGNFDYDFFNESQGGVYTDGSASKGIRSIELINDKIYIAGDFEGYRFDNVSPRDDNYQMMQRYSSDGSLDTLFTPLPAVSVTNANVYSLKPMNDNTIIIGGSFSGGINSYLARINNDGSENPTVPLITTGTEVRSLYSDPDNNFLVIGGLFTNITPYAAQNLAVAAVASSYLVLDPLDAATVLQAPVNSGISDIDISLGGDLYLGGDNAGQGLIAKYEYNEGLSQFVFNADFENQFYNIELFRTDNTPPSPFNSVNVVKADLYGNVLVGGNFNDLQDFIGNKHNNIVRLLPSGMIDPSFRLDIDGPVYDIEIQQNGKILVAGAFSMVNNNGIDRGIVRVETYGDIDWEFNTSLFPEAFGALGPIYTIAVQEQTE